jgi:predicted transcriptional regulator
MGNPERWTTRTTDLPLSAAGATLVTPFRRIPMSTTSLKIPEDVKELAVAAARQQGVTPHAFMVDAIRAAATNAQRRARFVADAIASREEAIETGNGYAAEDVHAYLQARVQGKSAHKPKAKPWRA